MVGAYFDKTVSNRSKSQSKNDSYYSKMDTSIGARTTGIIKDTTITKEESSTIKEEAKGIYKEDIKSQQGYSLQRKQQLYQTQLTKVILLSDLNIERFISSSVGLEEITMTSRLKLAWKENRESKWCKPNFFSYSGGNLSIFEDDAQSLTEDYQLKFA